MLTVIPTVSATENQTVIKSKVVNNAVITDDVQVVIRSVFEILWVEEAAVLFDLQALGLVILIVLIISLSFCSGFQLRFNLPLPNV